MTTIKFIGVPLSITEFSLVKPVNSARGYDTESATIGANTLLELRYVCIIASLTRRRVKDNQSFVRDGIFFCQSCGQLWQYRDGLQGGGLDISGSERTRHELIEISAIAFACVFGGALLGILIGARLPENHLSPETKDVVRLGMALVGTIGALVLSFFITSAKTYHDRQRDELTQTSAKVVLLGRLLQHYGPEASAARKSLRAVVGGFWSAPGRASEQRTPKSYRKQRASRIFTTRWKGSGSKTTGNE